MMLNRLKDTDKHSFLQLVEQKLEKRISGVEDVLTDAMRYHMLEGGKRLRPLAVYLGALASDGDAELNATVDLACVLELIHGYSLVHDDLSCMDDAKTRRGKEAVHVKYGEWCGVLTGDMLLSVAMKTLCLGCARYGHNFARAASEIAMASCAMVCGQSEDMQGCKTEAEFEEMHSQKTGALFLAAFRAGAIVAGASDDVCDKISKYAELVGYAFQLRDDLEDGDLNSIVSVIGAEQAAVRLEATLGEAVAIATALSPALVDFAEALRIDGSKPLGAK